jgi:hypothetical protein
MNCRPKIGAQLKGTWHIGSRVGRRWIGLGHMHLPQTNHRKYEQCS